MSMFHELMMRKKEEIMYATIKGTLTENDGVFSGFSGTNYLSLQDTIAITPTKKFEIVTKVKFNYFSNTSSFIGTFGEYGIVLRTTANKELSLNVGDGTSWIFTNEFSANTFVVNTDYFFKLTINNGLIKLLSSTDGTHWTEEINRSITISGQYDYNITLGIGRVNTTYFDGSIDLNNSYIKLGSTKYNLQAVVGYTVVGSPTITDGVVTNLSSSNYLTVPNFPYVSADSWEIVINADTTYNSGQQQQRLLRINSYFQFQVQGTNPVWQFYNGTSAYNIINSESGFISTCKFVKMVKSSGASSIQFYVSTDGITWITGNTIAISSSATDGNMNIGTNGNGWLGTVNLNNTYIKVNNKLWFNGQQA